MQTVEHPPMPALRRVGRGFGYGVAVAVNLAVLFVILNILDWDWLPFLTGAFTDVVPWMAFSLIVSIIANVVYVFYDDPVFHSAGQMVVNAVSLIATVRVFQVFPFDFSSYDFNWGIVLKVVLILAIVGTVVGMVTEFVKLVSGRAKREKGASDAYGI